MTGQADALANEPPLRALRRRLAPGIVAMARAGETAKAPGVLHENPAFFHDPAQFEREYRTLFREMRLVACLSSQLAEPGSYRTFDDAGVPMLIVRAAPVNEVYSVTGESHAGLAALPEGVTLPIGLQEPGVQNFHNNVRRFTQG